MSGEPLDRTSSLQEEEGTPDFHSLSHGDSVCKPVEEPSPRTESAGTLLLNLA